MALVALWLLLWISEVPGGFHTPQVETSNMIFSNSGLLNLRRLCRALSTASPKERIFTANDRTNLCAKLKQLNVEETSISLTVNELRSWRLSQPGNLKSTVSQALLFYDVSTWFIVGLVPTMGALHNGHLTLITRAKQENDLVAASIFVNPAQFAPHEDYTTYPWQPETDLEEMFRAGVSHVTHLLGLQRS